MPTPTVDTTTPRSLSPPTPNTTAPISQPQPPSFAALLTTSPTTTPLPPLLAHHLRHLAAYLAAFAYNTAPGPEHTPAIQAVKSLPLRAIAATARRILHSRRPLRCLEAVVVALHVLAGAEATVGEQYGSVGGGGVRLLRYPLRFYSTCGGHRYWHILLVVALMPLQSASSAPSSPSSSTTALPVFGAVSLSRHAPLSFRELTFGSLSSLCSSLRDEYARIGHSLLQMTVGLPASPDERSRDALDWHFLALQLPVSKQYHHDNAANAAASASQQSATAPTADDADEQAADGDCEMATSPPVSRAVDSPAVLREWRRVCDVLDRYAVRAAHYAAQMAHNRQRPAQARPLAPLHPHCHFDPRTQQLRYEGTTTKRRDSVRATPTKAADAQGVQREAGKAPRARVEKSASVTSASEVPPSLQRRHTLPARRTGDRSAFAV